MNNTLIKTDGYCINKLIERLENKIGKTAAHDLKKTAIEVVQNCVDVYSGKFGIGDVGANGTGLVSCSQKGDIPNDTTGLIYGRVQSGKTNATIATLAIAQENGFRCFIVLTSDNTWLGKQTANRFNEQLEGGPVVFDWEQWKTDPNDFAANKLGQYIDDTGVVLVSTKNVNHLNNLLTALKSAKASRVPTLIFDDEADNASLNTNEAKQSKKGKETIPDSAIFDGIGKIRQAVSNHMYGYRQKLKDVTRLFLPEHILEAFRDIHEADTGTRKAIGNDPKNIKTKPVWIGKPLKPTRFCVLNPAQIDTFTPGSAIFPRDPLWKKAEIKDCVEKLDSLLSKYQEGDEYHEVDIDFMIEVLSHTPSRSCPGYNWDDKRIVEALKAIKSETITKGRLNVRRGQNGKGLNLSNKTQRPWQGSGFATSEWISKPKQEYQEVPTLVIMYQKGETDKGWDNQPLYLPTLVFPKSKFVFMFNYSEEDENIGSQE